MHVGKLFAGLFLLFFITARGQYITHGPVTGAVTDHSCKVYIRTDIPQNYSLEYSTDSLFSAFQSISSRTDSSIDNCKILLLENLAAYTQYNMRFVFDGNVDSLRGSFKTFPANNQPEHLLFVTGSCQETPNMKVFDVMASYHPDLFVHTGDFTYPSYQIPGFLQYPKNYDAVVIAWRKRYEENRTRELIRNVPMAYMPDDDDNWGNSRDHISKVPGVRKVGNKIYNYQILDTITRTMRMNCFEGYNTFFPGYKPADDTEGYYHAFRVGNCEFFMLDARSCGDGSWRNYNYNAGANWWSFNTQSGFSLLGQKQLNWFLNAIKNSTATWKFIVSGVPFNQNLQRLVELPLLLQNVEFTISGETGTGFRLSTSFADYWAGFPQERNTVLKFIKDNNIKNVAVISGDTHHNVMDDGKNAGLPEMNASGMSVARTDLAYQIDKITSILGAPIKNWLWNKGGNGLGNDRLTNAFGKIEIFGDDSVEFCIVDEDNVVLTCMTLKNQSVPTSVQFQSNEEAKLEIFPSPAKDQLSLKIKFTDLTETISSINIYDLGGKLVLSFTNRSTQQVLNIQSIPKGLYAVSINTNKRIVTDLFVKN